MRFSKIFFFFSFLCIVKTVQSQSAYTIEVLDSGRNASLRGLSVVSDSIVWVSGSNGTVARSADGGRHFEWMQVQGFEKRDFRDIEAFDAQTAVIMAIGEPAELLRTTDGGQHWQVVFADNTKGMFLDAMSFTGHLGMVVGDPVNGRLFIAFTTDSGKSWNRMHPYMPDAETGEACFASSGTNLQTIQKKRMLYSALVTGGRISRMHLVPFDGSRIITQSSYLPLVQGKESTGANSIAINGKHWLIVGGDFEQPAGTEGNCLLSTNNGKSWQKPLTPPNGYRSCVAFLDKKRAAACGLTGVDITEDDGIHWSAVSGMSFHAVQQARTGTAVFLVGVRGRIGKLAATKN